MIMFIKKRWQQLLIISMFVLIIALLISSELFPKYCNYILFTALVFCLLIVVLVFLFLFIKLIKIIKHGLHNLHRCDIECFDKIDDIKRFFNNSNINYKRQIEYINFCYSDKGEIGKLAKNNKLYELYYRLDFLKKNNMFYNDIVNNYTSFIISIIVSVVIAAFGISNDEFEIVGGAMRGIIAIFAIVAFFAVIMLKYYKRGEMGSLLYLVDEYEIELLEEKIRKIEECYNMKKDDEPFLFSKQYTLDSLLNKNSKSIFRSKRKEILKDIECVENLNLYMSDYSQYVIKKYDLNGNLRKNKNNATKEIFLIYKKGNDGKPELVNDDYKKFKAILDKYNLINIK